MVTSITLKNENGEYKVKVKEESMALGEVFEKLVEPVLHAAGYDRKLIDEYIGRYRKEPDASR